MIQLFHRHWHIYDSGTVVKENHNEEQQTIGIVFPQWKVLKSPQENITIAVSRSMGSHILKDLG